MSAPIRAAAIQAGSTLFDTPATLAKARALLADALSEGARLIVFPEAFLGGYPKGVDFGVRVGMRAAEGRALFRRYAEAAITVPGPETDAIAKTLRNADAVVVMGAVERAGATLYCVTLTFDGARGLVAKHRKLMPTALERVIWGMGGADGVEPARTDVGVIGTAICWESYMPLYRAHLYAAGVTHYCAPTVDDRETWAPTMRMIAIEGRCFVISACQHMRRSDAPADFDPVQGNDPDAALIWGGSCIIGPDGAFLADPVFDHDAIVTAELDPARLLEGKFDLDVAGHYARPDVFALALKES